MDAGELGKKVGEWLEKLVRGKKGLVAYGVAFVLLVGLYLLYSQEKPEASPVTVATEEAGLEERLGEALSQMRGAGQVRVLITYETGEELVTATVSTTDESISGGEGSTSSQKRETVQPATVTTEAGQQAIVLYEKEPQIRGVLVVAEGAGDPSVRLNLQRAVMAVTGVSLDRIEVFEMGYGS